MLQLSTWSFQQKVPFQNEYKNEQVRNNIKIIFNSEVGISKSELKLLTVDQLTKKVREQETLNNIKFSWINSQEDTKQIAEMLSLNLNIKNNNPVNQLWRINKVEENKRLCSENVGWCQKQQNLNLANSVADIQTQVNKELQYPIVCKPQVGVGNQGVKFINNDEELISYIEPLKLENSHGLLMCELKQIGQHQIIIGTTWNGVTKVSAMQYLNQVTNSHGSFVNNSFILMNPAKDDQAMKIINFQLESLKALDYNQGFTQNEYIYDERQGPINIDFNPRELPMDQTAIPLKQNAQDQMAYALTDYDKFSNLPTLPQMDGYNKIYNGQALIIPYSCKWDMSIFKKIEEKKSFRCWNSGSMTNNVIRQPEDIATLNNMTGNKDFATVNVELFNNHDEQLKDIKEIKDLIYKDLCIDSVQPEQLINFDFNVDQLEKIKGYTDSISDSDHETMLLNSNLFGYKDDEFKFETQSILRQLGSFYQILKQFDLQVQAILTIFAICVILFQRIKRSRSKQNAIDYLIELK